LPISGARIRIIGSSGSDRTDQAGHFRLEADSGQSSIVLSISIGSLNGTITFGDIPINKGALRVGLQIVIDLDPKQENVAGDPNEDLKVIGKIIQIQDRDSKDKTQKQVAANADKMPALARCDSLGCTDKLPVVSSAVTIEYLE
jgi:hypothetical protein